MIDTIVERQHFEPFKHIAEGVSDTKMLKPFILEAQQMDIMPRLGNSFWYDIIQNKNSDKYKKLLEGGTYIVEDKTLYFMGLYAAIVYFTYSRYIIGRQATDTPTGMVQKLSGAESKPADPSILMRNSASAKAVGQQYLNEAIEFIEKNEQTYPLYFDGVTSLKKSKRTGSIRITPISRRQEPSRCSECGRKNCNC